jgi:putative hydrolase of the HAD superfamily
MLVREKGRSAMMTTRILRYDASHAGGRSPLVISRAPNGMASSAPWPLRGLIFDMGDVLYDATAWRRWLLGVLRQFGVARDYASLFGHWDHIYLNAVHCGGRDYQEAFAAFLSELGLAPPQVEEVCAASAGRKHELAAALRPLPGVRPTLERLRAEGFTLGVLSDSEDCSGRLWQRLEGLGLAASIGAVVSSRDIGCTKPAPLAYETVLAAMQVAPHEAAFVGHDEDELRGAAAVALKTIAVNHQPRVQADARLQRFEELAYVVTYREETAIAA